MKRPEDEGLGAASFPDDYASLAKPVIPDAVRAVLEDNIAEYPNAEIEAFLAGETK